MQWSETPICTRGAEFLGGGQTPLMVAALNGNIEAVHALLAAGANPNATTSGTHSWFPPGTSSLRLIVYGGGSGCEDAPRNTAGIPQVVRTLMAAGARDAQESLQAAQCADWEVDDALMAALRDAVSEAGGRSG